MRLNPLLEALNSFGSTIDSPWDASSLRKLSEANWDSIAGTDWLVEADYRVVLLRWLAESAQPVGEEGKPEHIQRAKVLDQVVRYVEEIDPLESTDSAIEARRELVKALDRVSWRIAESGRSKRLHLDDADRRELLDSAGTPARCYLCGFSFGHSAIAAFLRQEEPSFQAMPFVDMFFPRGRRGTDLRIEIDHMRPRARGGTNDLTNLRPTCGYCNRVKSDSLTLLDKTRYGPLLVHPTYGRMRLPHPAWVLRMLAIVGVCDLCGATGKSAKLVVAPIVWSTLINPLNLRVFCSEHDPIAEERLVRLKLLR